MFQEIVLVFQLMKTVNAVAAVLAFVIGSAVASAYHWAWWAPFVISLATVILLTLVVWLILHCLDSTAT